MYEFERTGGFDPEPNAESIRQLIFEKLSTQWKSESVHLSSIAKKCSFQSYQQIIAMGQAVVPLILNDLRLNGPNDWFVALTEITGENPITKDIAGNMAAMTEAWLKWGAVNRPI